MKSPKLQYDKKAFSKLIKERIKNPEDSEVAEMVEDFVGKLLGGESGSFFSEQFNPDENTLTEAKEMLQSEFEGLMEDLVMGATEDIDWEQFDNWSEFKKEGLELMKSNLEDSSTPSSEFNFYSPKLEKYLISCLREEWDLKYSSED